MCNRRNICLGSFHRRSTSSGQREVEQVLETGTVPPPPTVREKAAVLREHYACLREVYGDRVAGHVVRRVIHWFVKGASGSAALRAKGNTVETPEQFEALVAEFEGARLEDSAKDAALRA